ncbi:MAG: bifunctional phosphoglucose/phosphomannose isomerase [Actinomycetota bacterium]|nr:bifunctional phosphoglucose/phosphomannose isomerase [Actinomycetota bacterium]
MSDMLTQIRTLGNQLRWAADVELPPVPTASDVLIAGMGGSGIAGDFVTALASMGSGRVAVQKGYGPLPGWALDRKPLLIAISFSGNTEETLDVVAAAAATEIPILTLTTGGELGRITAEKEWPTISVPGGIQPRAAVGYLFGAVARVVAAAGLIPDQHPALIEAAEAADDATSEGSPSWLQAADIAHGLAGRIPIVYGGGPVSGAVAQRWKTQINENAKTPSWWSVLPELDHNELVGWEAMPSLTRQYLGVVALTDATDHPRVLARLAHSRALTENAVPWVAEVVAEGDTPLARLMSLVVMGDLVSFMLAETAGVDPVPVDTIEKLKKLLTEV